MENYVEVELPSKGRLYEGIEKVQIRTFIGRDEKLLAEMSTDNFDKKFSKVLKGVLTGVDPNKLTVGDRLYLALWETINSYSKDFSVEYECEHCWEKSPYSVDLSKLEVIELDKDFNEPYEVRLPGSGELIKLRLLRVEDMAKIHDLGKLGKNVWLYRYALSLVNEQGIWDNVDYLEKLGSKDLMIIRGFQDEFYHGPKMECAYECPKCGGTGIMPVPFRLEMLLPYGERLAEYIGDAIRPNVLLTHVD